METTFLPCHSLGTLPYELVLLILDQFDDDDLPAIHALNMTNWHFHHITLGHMYRRFPGRAPEKFLRTIALTPPRGCPTIAEYVKEVVWYQDYWLPESLHRMVDPATRRQLARGLGARAYPRVPELSSRFTAFPHSPELHWWYLEFFLFFVPKVERLIVHEVDLWDRSTSWFENIAAHPTQFEHLQSITLDGTLRLENIVPLLTLPSLRSLSIESVIETDEVRTYAWYDQSVAERLAAGSSVEHLKIGISYMGLSSFIPLFQVLNSLKSFSYSQCPDDVDGHYYDFNYDALAQCLLHQHASLEHLTLNDPFLGYWRASSLLSALQCVTRLRTLSISPPDLRAHVASNSSSGIVEAATEFAQRLPSTVELLQFHLVWTVEEDIPRGLADALEPFLHSLASVVKSALPRLQKLILKGWPPQLGIFPPGVIEVKQAFANVGVRFTSISEKLYGPGPFEILEDQEPGWMVVQQRALSEESSRSMSPS
ncbi:uncharacterized protein K460DRAFT_363427 [Cucurbitaria berberidis CBS 394.84]|uniref:F-box domain-containing protein n=1 Tax=Cucurbitaria berberidis CBS 394.84 TaxID=1168544 RepID=A0A9P4GL46_9PLEO|nr:uncharacterized protein K460DRAFT_363427 [Cucurbitaria berberidis CBS 394.84]KAF1847336.1 hypothetical protein K460DRAFT_363427 [Cucurbitaria berberidis CBS 394.84]